jgi:hypothetical protein
MTVACFNAFSKNFILKMRCNTREDSSQDSRSRFDTVSTLYGKAEPTYNIVWYVKAITTLWGSARTLLPVLGVGFSLGDGAACCVWLISGGIHLAVV